MWKFWKKKSPKEKALEKYQALRKLPTIYANHLDKIQMFSGLEIRGACFDQNGNLLKNESPKIVYGWLDPDCGIEENKAWLLLSIDDFFFEINMEHKEGEKIVGSGQSNRYDWAELENRLAHGDFDHMFNTETDRTVTEDLKEMLKKNKLN